MYYFITSKNHR